MFQSRESLSFPEHSAKKTKERRERFSLGTGCPSVRTSPKNQASLSLQSQGALRKLPRSPEAAEEGSEVRSQGLCEAYPLKLQALGKLIFYRHIAHVTQKVEKLCFLRGKEGKDLDRRKHPVKQAHSPPDGETFASVGSRTRAQHLTHSCLQWLISQSGWRETTRKV